MFYAHFPLPPQPSLSILQSFMNSCHRDKAYSRLSAVVKKAKESGLQLEKIFYQRALVELRQWGQDQDAITAIYKALRKIDLNQSQKGTQDACVGVHEHVVYMCIRTLWERACSFLPLCAHSFPFLPLVNACCFNVLLSSFLLMCRSMNLVSPAPYQSFPV